MLPSPTYLQLGMLWAAIYTLVARLISTAFVGIVASSQPLHGFDALHFSLITLTTTRYREIAPVAGPARMLAMLEASHRAYVHGGAGPPGWYRFIPRPSRANASLTAEV